MTSKALIRNLASLTLNARKDVCPSCRFASLIAPRIHKRGATTGPPPSLPNPPLSVVGAEPEGTESESAKASASAGATQNENTGLPRVEEPAGDIFKQIDTAPGGPQEPAMPTPLYMQIGSEAFSNVYDPDPDKRQAWERKKVIQRIRKRWVLTKEEQIKRTERECQVSSQTFKTSTKKLVHLARQIAGKPIEEAIVQMQFSKKRVAWDIMNHLEYAKNLAIVSRGMGLGEVEGRQGEPVEIELKDGKRKVVPDRTGIYVDQAWVNKGTVTKSREYRGRGRVNILTHRRAKITVRLKEEATRIRESEERKEKKAKRKLWQHLPDRPITLQRQYPLW